MNLDLHDWKEFRTGDLFPVMERGKASQQKLEEGIDCFYVGAKREDNGVMLHCRKDLSLLTRGNCIVFICNGEGSVGFANYIDVDFIGTTDIMVGYNEYLNERTGAFLATIYSLERPKYSFGRKWGAYLKDTIVRLPAKKESSDSFYIDPTHKFSEMGYVPDWQFMEDYINSLHCKHLTTSNRPNQVPLLNIQQWKEFKLTDLFIVKGGFYNKKPEHSITGNIPFLASTESNNGVTEYYSLKDIEQWDKVGNEDWTLNKKLYTGNCIAVTVNGSVCNAFYQKEQFTCSHDITVLYLKQGNLTPHIAIFLCTIIMLEKYRWSYGRKPHDVKKFGKSIIKLPVTASGKPDWQFMENYIKSLPYGDRLE